MKKILFAFLFLSFITAAQAATQYSAAIEDLPLMPDMTEDKSSVVIFDAPEGRIIETNAKTGSGAAEVSAWYNAALPPLGWQPTSALSFRRDREKLVINIDKGVAHFKISPTE